MKHHEDSEQVLVFEWAAYHPALRYMFAIPNGGNRNKIEAARLKKQGVKAGVLDIFLPVVRVPYHGLFVEMKRRKQDGPSKVSPKQLDFQKEMELQGYKCVICYGAEEAIKAISEYIKF